MSERVILQCGECGIEVSRRTGAHRNCWDCGAAMKLIRDDYPVQVTEVSRDKWPFWAWSLKWMRTKADKGVGDTAQRLAAMMGGEQFKKLAEKIGLPCGCTERQAEWNRSYPYEADQ